MSGHSKWAKIKRQKGANDTKRGALFTKLAKTITLLASEGGGDPDMNFSLRLAIEKAKQANMPLTNIEKAIKRGTGELNDGIRLERIIYEGLLPNGAVFIVDCTTDNKNRTVADLRKIFEKHGGSIGVNGSVSWQFNEVGFIQIQPQRLLKSNTFGKMDTYEAIEDKEALELELLEVEGIEDIQEDSTDINITTPKNMFAQVANVLQSKNLKIDNSEIRFLARESLNIDETKTNQVLELMSELDDHDDVDNVFTNVNLD